MKQTRGKYSRAISNIRRAVNRLGGYSNQPHFSSVKITDVKTTPLYVEWTENGSRMKAEYKDIANVTRDAQELRLRLQVSLAENQELEALHQLKTKGKVSWQFKKSVESNYSILMDTIKQFDDKGYTKDAIVKMFEDQNIEETEATAGPKSFSNSGTKNLFYHVYGFSEFNLLTANLFRAMTGGKFDE